MFGEDLPLFSVRPLSSAAHDQLLPKDGVQEAIKERNPSLEMTSANERRRRSHKMTTAHASSAAAAAGRLLDRKHVVVTRMRRDDFFVCL